MDARTLLQSIDIWCQWDSAFGEDARELMAYFIDHQDTLEALLLQMLASRGKQPTKKWWNNWTELKKCVPASLLRAFLIGLAGKRGWYKGRASETDSRVLAAREIGLPPPADTNHEYTSINVYGTHAYTITEGKHWQKQGNFWYECLPEAEVYKTYRISHGACWALVDFLDSQVRDLLMYMIHIKHYQTAIWTLAQWADEDATARLLQIQRLTTHQGILARIESVLPEMANQRGMTVEELKEHALFTHGLNIQGERSWQVGEFTLRLSVSPGGRVMRSIKGADGKTLPDQTSVQKETWQKVHETRRIMEKEAKSLSRLLSTQKKHLERCMREQRDWSMDGWKNTIAIHLSPRNFARQLVWSISQPDGTHYTYAFLDKNGGWHNAEGEVITISGEHHLRIAHPVEMTPEDHSCWQRYIVKHKITQPFRQMFRETYLITPAEEETRTYSNRFSAHVIPSHRMQVPHRRGWHCSTRVCWHDFRHLNIRAYIWAEYNYTARHDVLRQIAFYPLDHSTVWSQPRLDLDPACLLLPDIPPITFSEVMRDIDQCLVSASQGTNQQWADVDKTQVDFGEQARRRGIVLQEIIPQLDLETTVRVEGRCAYISGKRCHYRVDLENGTIHINPSGRYLCIVPRYDTQRLYLPFGDGDPKTAEIVSKILLLANDAAITDQSILRQLPARLLNS